MLFRSLAEEGLSLLKVIDKTVTPMGGRKLRSWVSFPLLDIEEITRRQDAVEYFFRDVACRDRCEEALRRVGDLERLMAKLASNRIGPRDFVSLRDSLRAADTLRNVLSESGSEVFVGMSREMSDTSQLYETIARVIVDDAPNQLGRGNAIAAGVDAELDELRGLHANSRRALEEIRDRESELTGIPSLKIAFNNVFGYYIEVRNTHKDKVPETWIRKQTLVSAERYITPELKEYEEKIVGAEEKISAIENRLFAELVQGALTFIPRIQRNAKIGRAHV